MKLLDLKITCPACTAQFKLSESVQDETVKKISILAASFGPDWNIVLSYLACFRTAKGRGIRPERLVVILEELAEIWKLRRFRVRGAEHPVHPQVLRATIREVGLRCDTLFGLRDHAYLKTVLVGKMQKWDHRQAKEERAATERHRNRSHKKEPEDPAGESGPGRVEMKKYLNKIKNESTDPNVRKKINQARQIEAAKKGADHG